MSSKRKDSRVPVTTITRKTSAQTGNDSFVLLLRWQWPSLERSPDTKQVAWSVIGRRWLPYHTGYQTSNQRLVNWLSHVVVPSRPAKDCLSAKTSHTRDTVCSVRHQCISRTMFLSYQLKRYFRYVSKEADWLTPKSAASSCCKTLTNKSRAGSVTRPDGGDHPRKLKLPCVIKVSQEVIVVIVWLFFGLLSDLSNTYNSAEALVPKHLLIISPLVSWKTLTFWMS